MCLAGIANRDFQFLQGSAQLHFLAKIDTFTDLRPLDDLGIHLRLFRGGSVLSLPVKLSCSIVAMGHSSDSNFGPPYSFQSSSVNSGSPYLCTSGCCRQGGLMPVTTPENTRFQVMSGVGG